MDISNNMGAQAQRDLLDKLGLKSAEEVQNNSRDTLGQEEFLTLMTAQLQNQDPMEPMDNGDFIAQMAQFSTVTGITDMANSMKAMADELKQFRVASISNIMGNSVWCRVMSQLQTATANCTACLNWTKLPSIPGLILLTPKAASC